METGSEWLKGCPADAEPQSRQGSAAMGATRAMAERNSAPELSVFC